MERLQQSDWIRNGYINAEKKQMVGTVDTHWHDFFELELILSGSGNYIIDGVHYPIVPGMLFFITPMNFHRVETQECSLYNLMFSGDVGEPAFLSHLTECAPFAKQTGGEALAYYDAVLGAVVRHQGTYLCAIAMLNALLGKLVTDMGQSALPTLTPVKRLELYMQNNFRNHLTLETAAKWLMYSPGYLSQLFKRETGKSFKAYLNTLRYEYAKKLLAFSDLPVIQVCAESGFEDYPNFVRRFKLYAGMYPLAYRAQARRMITV